MKKFYTFLTVLLFSSMVFGQTFDNNGGTGDNLWSTATNWIGDVLPVANAGVTISADVTLDVTIDLDKLTATGPYTLSGAGKITFTGADKSLAIVCNGDFTYNAALEISNGVGLRKHIKNSTGFQLTFGSLSVLTLTSGLQLDSVILTGAINFDGVIEGAEGMRINDNVVFGASSDNSGFTGSFVLLNDSNVVSNNTGNGSFKAAGSKLQINKPAVVTINGANSCDANVSVGGSNTLELNINANQESLGTVLVADGTLTVNVDAAVTNLSFADSSAEVWGTGAVVITGYELGEIRFGTSNTALTTAQLSQITADGAATGEVLALDADGYLVLDSSLSTNSFTLESQKRISYPTVVENNIYFSNPMSNIQVYNVTGSKIFEVSKKSTIESLATSQLNSGMYFIVFEGVKVERFIKK